MFPWLSVYEQIIDTCKQVNNVENQTKGKHVIITNLIIYNYKVYHQMES